MHCSPQLSCQLALACSANLRQASVAVSEFWHGCIFNQMFYLCPWKSNQLFPYRSSDWYRQLMSAQNSVSNRFAAQQTDFLIHLLKKAKRSKPRRPSLLRALRKKQQKPLQIQQRKFAAYCQQPLMTAFKSLKLKSRR